MTDLTALYQAIDERIEANFAADAEISLCFDVRDQLTRMTVLVRKREIRILRNVSPERQNIADLLLF